MTEGKPRIMSIHPVHPDLQKRETQQSNPSHLVAYVDTGLKSGKLTEVHITLGQALMLSTQLSTGIATIVRARNVETDR